MWLTKFYSRFLTSHIEAPAVVVVGAPKQKLAGCANYFVDHLSTAQNSFRSTLLTSAKTTQGLTQRRRSTQGDHVSPGDAVVAPTYWNQSLLCLSLHCCPHFFGIHFKKPSCTQLRLLRCLLFQFWLGLCRSDDRTVCVRIQYKTLLMKR